MLKIDFTSFPVLETERLILRAHDTDDVANLYALRTSEAVMQYIDRPRPASLDDVKLFINTLNDGYLQGNNLAWVIALKEKPQEMIGSIGYWRMDLANYRAEMGYMLHPDFWRKGIISEALKKTVEFGFKEMKLHSIAAHINPGNDASRQMLLKHGFVKEAAFKENYYFNGRFLDSEVYGLLNPVG